MRGISAAKETYGAQKAIDSEILLVLWWGTWQFPPIYYISEDVTPKPLRTSLMCQMFIDYVQQ